MQLKEENFFETLSQVAKQNLLNVEEMQTIIKDAILKIFYIKFDPDAQIDIFFNKDTNALKIINNSKIVIIDKEYDREFRAIEVPLKEAKKIHPKIKVGDLIAEKVDLSLFNNQITNQMKQIITQNIREKKKEYIYEKYKSFKNKIIKAKIISVTSNYAILTLNDGTTAFMPSKFQNLQISLRIGETIDVYIEEVLQESKDSQLIVSNNASLIVRKLLEIEIPEINEGIIEIKNIAREAGIRTKIAVKTNNENIDPIGSIIGVGGSRINEIVSKINNEKIDIVLWSTDIVNFIINAFLPARVISVLDKRDENNKLIENYKTVITPNKHQTLAIGKAGINIRLIAELTKCKIDIVSFAEAQKNNLKIIWNGNVEVHELEKIESGVKQKFMLQKHNYKKNYSQQQSTLFNFKEIMDDISNFSELMKKENKSNNNAQDVKFENENFFSQSELEAMEKNFMIDIKEKDKKHDKKK